MEDLIYIIGETVLLENDNIIYVTYPKNIDKPNCLFFKIENGETYKLTLTKEKM